MTNVNGETVKMLVEKLPPHIFGEMVFEFPDLLEIEPWQTQYIN